MFFSYKDDWSRETIETNIFNDESNLLVNTSFFRENRFTQLSALLKLGVAYEDDYINWGLTITTTGVPTFLFTGALMHRSETSNIPGNKLHYYDIYNEWENAWERYPWEIDTGVQFMLMGGVINLRMTYFSKVGAHTVSEFGPEAEIVANEKEPLYPELNAVWYAGRSFLNFAIGYERLLSDKVVLLAGFKTDNNAFDNKSIDRSELWTSTKGYWNLYCVSAGVDFHTERHGNILFGLALKNSWRKNDTQIVNLTNLDSSNHYQGIKDNSARTNITGASLILGYTYTFNVANKKDIRDKMDGINPFLLKSKDKKQKDKD